MGLRDYYEKRDFKKTPEPRGKVKGTNLDGRSFVVQKHAASHLHYDFRLELDGVLLSWAVPKGPSLDPSTKRLAMRTEDHPLEYASFEGTIPKGEYGGGTVLVWDRGTWEPEGDPRQALARGRLKFRLNGQKLGGVWNLVRTRARDKGDARSWLLFKSRDERAAHDGDAVVEALPQSVLSGRTLDEVARAPDRVWHSNRSDSNGQHKPNPAALKGAKAGRLPAKVSPVLATLVERPPVGDGFLHEIKLDGYRLLCKLAKGKVTLLTRNGQDWTRKLPELERTLAELPIDRAVFDGELVVLDEHGKSDFQRLQNALGTDTSDVLLYLFDLIYLDGYDLGGVPLELRKQSLLELLRWAGALEGRIRYSDHVVGNGEAFYAGACELGLEGIVSKQRTSRYQPGRSKVWLKSKCQSRQEFVIIGYTEPSGSRSHFGALLLAVHDERGRLSYSGKVGTGFTARSLAELAKKLRPLERRDPPLDDPPRGAEARRAHWVTPRLVAEVEFTGFTEDGRLRHPSFRGLREDKPTRDVSLETAAPADDAPAKRAPAKRAPKKRAPVENDVFSGPSQVRLTNPDRVLYPEVGITKRDLAEYYVRVAERMLPHVRNRPLTLVRCPQGRAKQCFYQKHALAGMPKAIRPIPIEEKGKTAQYTAIDDLAGLVSLVQFGTLEVHIWGAHADLPERPDLLVFDLDPDTGLAWSRVVEAALLVRHHLQALGLESYVKTTGGKGLHVVLPIVRRSDWDEVHAFCQAVANTIVEEQPNAYVSTMSKAKRKNKVFIDHFRNARGATAIAPYSSRARPGAPVAVPVEWSALETLRPQTLTVTRVPEHLQAEKRDPWQGFFELKQSITKKMKRSVGLD